jgi:hypothetical protein
VNGYVLLNAEQRRYLLRYTERAAIIGGAIEALCTGFAPWYAAQEQAAMSAKRSAAAHKAAATRFANKAQHDKTTEKTAVLIAEVEVELEWESAMLVGNHLYNEYKIKEKCYICGKNPVAGTDRCYCCG